MIEHFKGEEVFIGKVKKYIHLVTINQQVVTTPFLNPYQIKIINSMISKELDLIKEVEGAIVNSEMQRLVLAPSYYSIEYQDFDLCLLKFKYNNKFDSLSHRDILGTLMSLGIQREKFGDIVEGDSCFYVAVDQSVVDLLMIHVDKIKRAKVKITISKDKVERVQEYTKKTIILSSLRLDKVVSGMFLISRTKAVDLIRAGLVKVNYKVVEEVDFLCNNEDILSVRRYGRVLLQDTCRKTKSDNFVIEGNYYK